MLVAQVLIRHPDELESDLLMHFGVDICGFWRGELTLRRLTVLIRRLLRMHGQSAVAEAYLGKPASWSNTEYILADLRDSIEAGNYLFLSAHKSEGYTMPAFQPYPRPGVELSQLVRVDEPDWATASDIAQLFNQMHGG
jgi:hypothetical protein